MIFQTQVPGFQMLPADKDRRCQWFLKEGSALFADTQTNGS